MGSSDRDGKPPTPAIPPRASSPDPSELFRDLAEDPDAAEPSARPHNIPVSRTLTLDDPMTTQLLAEVARRNVTIEISPEMIEDAHAAAAAGEPAEADEPAPGAADTPAPSRGRR